MTPSTPTSATTPRARSRCGRGRSKARSGRGAAPDSGYVTPAAETPDKLYDQLCTGRRLAVNFLQALIHRL